MGYDEEDKRIFRVQVQKVRTYAIRATDAQEAESIVKEVSNGTPKKGHLDCIMGLGTVVTGIHVEEMTVLPAGATSGGAA